MAMRLAITCQHCGGQLGFAHYEIFAHVSCVRPDAALREQARDLERSWRALNRKINALKYPLPHQGGWRRR